MSLVFQLKQASQIKIKIVMSWSTRKKKEGNFCPKEVFLKYVFYLNA